ncbi:unnamed protein product, partial [Meganyctiphanes norvegica]
MTSEYDVGGKKDTTGPNYFKLGQSGKNTFTTIWRALLLGQVASLLLCVTGACCHMLNNTYNLQLPAVMSGVDNFLSCLVFPYFLNCLRESFFTKLLYIRALIGHSLTADHCDNTFLNTKDSQGTTVTCHVITNNIILCSFVLETIEFKKSHKSINLLELVIKFWVVTCSIFATTDNVGFAAVGQERLLGDMLCLGGATLYGISNVAQEYIIKTFDSVEFLGMLGLFGSLINGVQLAILERNEVGSVRWDTWPVLALVGGFSAAQFLFYVVAPAVIRVTSATALNLALFTADFYILITGIALFRFKQFHPLYFLSYILVVTGVIVFVIKPTPITSANRGYYSGAAEVELQTTPGTATSSMGGGASFNEWPPLPPEVRGCPDYPYPHSHSQDFDYPATPPSPPQQFRSLPRPQRREAYPSSGSGGGGSGHNNAREGHQRSATLHRPARQLYRANGASSSTHDLGDVRC